MRLALFCAALILPTGIGSFALAQEASQIQRQVLERLTDRLPDVRSRLSELDTLPEEGGVLWGRGKDDAQADLNNILDEIITLIAGEDYNQSRERLFSLEQRISALDVAIGELRIKRLDAPPSELSILDQTLMREFSPGSQQAIDAEIASKSDELATMTNEREQLVRNFRQRLHDLYEIEISQDQAEAILYQINGSSIAEASIAFSVLQSIEARIAEIRSTTENEQILRRYYGVAALLRLVIVRLYEHHLAQYEQEWLPAIDALDANQDALMAHTEILIDAETDQTRHAQYQNNLEIQQNVAEVIDDYRDLLVDRQDMIRDRLQEATQDATLAINTLKTLENATIVFDQFSWSNEEFQALMSIQSTELIPLNDAEVTENYLELSRQMMGG